MKTLLHTPESYLRVRASKALILGVLTTVGVTLVLLWLNQQRTDALLANANTRLSAEARSVTRLIAYSLEQQARQLDLFIEQHRGELDRLAGRPDDEILRQRLLGHLQHLNPDVFTFSIADTHGDVIVEDFDGRIGEACRVEMHRFASLPTSTSRLLSHVHPQPGAYHVDLMVRMQLPGAQPGAMFISFVPSMIADLLRDAERAGDRFVLVRQDDPALVEMTSYGLRTPDQRIKPLSARASAGDPVSVSVEGTPWILLASAPRSALDAGVGNIRSQTAVLLALFLLLAAGAMIAALRHDAAQARRLQERETLLSTIFDTMVDGVVTIDHRGRISGINQATENLFGYGREEILGRNVSILMPEPHASAHDSYLQRYLETGVAGIIGVGREVQGRRKNGSVFEMSLAVGEWKQAGQHFFVGIVRDISERVRHLDQLQSKAEALQRSNSDLEQFAFVASHDLQEPMRKIASFGQLLQLEYGSALSGDGADYIRFMIAASNRMTALIDGLLEYSRVTTRRKGYERVRVAELAADILDDISLQVQEQTAQVRIDGDAEIEADPTQLRQLLQNLVGNAIKFHQPQTPPVVELRIAEVVDGENALVRIEVNDNGIGIEARFLDEIFKPFRRLHTRDQFSGIGLGLSICAKIVERHGGTLTASSDGKAGTTFHIILPARQQGWGDGASINGDEDRQDENATVRKAS